uniref:CAZy families GH3 protein n=1 Tax=uncultured Bacillus sp. TaxID=83428 RepID=A0A060CEC2_9BACI|nr:CAZy families GH3 protein [uncultured Bacillus sp.]
MSEFVKELISKMTFAEKVGQLTQLSGDFFVGDNAAITGPLQQENLSSADLYRVGSVLGVSGFEQVKKIQTNYLRKESFENPIAVYGRCSPRLSDDFSDSIGFSCEF